MLREAAQMARWYAKTPSEMLFRAVAVWRVDRAATQTMLSAEEADYTDESTAKHLYW
jgi:hypothetical protein